MPCPWGQEGECFKRTRSPPFRGENGKSEALWPDGLAGRHVQEEAAWGPTGSRQLRPRVGWPTARCWFCCGGPEPQGLPCPPESKARRPGPGHAPRAATAGRCHDTQRGTGDRVQGAPRDECYTGTCDLPLPRSVGAGWPSVPRSPAGPGQPWLCGSPSSSVLGHPCPVSHWCHQADKLYTLG